jgi:hypothetical protein
MFGHIEFATPFPGDLPGQIGACSSGANGADSGGSHPRPGRTRSSSRVKAAETRQLTPEARENTAAYVGIWAIAGDSSRFAFPNPYGRRRPIAVLEEAIRLICSALRCGKLGCLEPFRSGPISPRVLFRHDLAVFYGQELRAVIRTTPSGPLVVRLNFIEADAAG